MRRLARLVLLDQLPAGVRIPEVKINVLISTIITRWETVLLNCFYWQDTDDHAKKVFTDVLQNGYLAAAQDTTNKNDKGVNFRVTLEGNNHADKQMSVTTAYLVMNVLPDVVTCKD